MTDQDTIHPDNVTTCHFDGRSREDDNVAWYAWLCEDPMKFEETLDIPRTFLYIDIVRDRTGF